LKEIRVENVLPAVKTDAAEKLQYLFMDCS